MTKVTRHHRENSSEARKELTAVKKNTGLYTLCGSGFLT
jgi:hypothetical protein